MRRLAAAGHLLTVAGLVGGVPAIVGRAAEPAPLAHVAQGRLAGLRSGDVEAFLGVPYAAPPVGAYRWRAPQPAPDWRGLRAARRFAPSCYQTVLAHGIGPWTTEYEVHGQVSENCLYLNVWAPARATHPLPVLVWVPGGAYVAGSGSVPIYNGARLAARGIVVVTINYRLGVFGFFTDPALAAEAKRLHEPPGNWGLQDILAALRWVQRNVAAFGGDPRAITLAGQSAGAVAVQELLGAPLAAGLFARAIAESGLPDSLPTPPLADAEAIGTAFARSRGAHTLAALRALPAGVLATGVAPMTSPLIMPCVDGELLTAPPRQQLLEGRFAAIPVLLGVNANDRGGSAAASARLAGPAWHAFLHRTFGVMAARFATLYPAQSGSGRARSLRAVQRDLGLAALYAWSVPRLSHAQAPVYAYLWRHAEPGPHSAQWGAFHSSEIPYVFGTLAAAPRRRFTALDAAISRRMSRYWVDFIAHGDPNGRGLPHWPRLRLDDPRIMRLGAHPHSSPLLPPARLAAMQAFIAGGGKPGIFDSTRP